MKRFKSHYLSNEQAVQLAANYSQNTREHTNPHLKAHKYAWEKEATDYEGYFLEQEEE